MVGIEKHVHLIDYIHKEKQRGFHPEQIRQKLLDKGWKPELVDYHLKEALEEKKPSFFSNMFVKKSGQQKPEQPKQETTQLLPFLKEEKIVSKETAPKGFFAPKQEQKPERQEKQKQAKSKDALLDDVNRIEEDVGRKIEQEHRQRKAHDELQEQIKKELGSYLPRNEKAEDIFNIGNYKIIATNKRLILVEKMPRNLVEMDYKEIDFVEYYTYVQWWNLGYALLLSVITWLLFANKESIWINIAKAFPDTINALDIEVIFGLNIVMFFIILILLFFLVKNIASFASSLFGRLRILPKDEGPVEIISQFSDDVKNLIKLVEEKKD